MSIHEHLQELHGLPAYEFPATDGTEALPAADAVAWRLSVEPYDDDPMEFEELWQRFTRTVDLADVRALVIGQWGETYVDKDASVIVGLLTAAKDRLIGLEAIFLGDLVMEEAEISWIEQSDVTPLLDAFPGLVCLGVRGGSGLQLRPRRHAALRELRIEAGGLPAAVVGGVVESDFPALERLTLWLGVPTYGGDTELADLAPLLAGGRFPRLTHLGIQNSEIQDEIAAAVAGAPVVASLSSLSLSMGTLTDTGAEALLSGQPLTHLTSLDLHHNFLSEAMTKRLTEELTPSGVQLDLSDRNVPEVWRDQEFRYVSVSE